MMQIAVQTISAFLAVVFFGLLLEMPKRYLIDAGIVGGAAWLVYLLTAQWSGSNILAAFASTLVVAFISHIFARCFKAPVTVFLVAGILPAVPGASIYRCVFYVIRNDRSLATYYLVETLQIAGAIAVAIFIMDSIFRLIQDNEKRWKENRPCGNSGKSDLTDDLPQEPQTD